MTQVCACPPAPSAQSESPSGCTAPSSPGSELAWRPEWLEFEPWEYALVVGAAAVATAPLLVQDPGPPLITRVPPVDVRARNLVRSNSRRGRRILGGASDVLLALAVSYPLLGDGLINAGWYRRSPEVAQQLVLIDLEVLSVTAALTGVAKVLVGRERPFGQTCGGELDPNSDDCLDADRFFSFFSGHASAAFAAASATCMHHRYLPLWGETPSWVPCTAGYALAAAAGFLRMRADVHYLTDIGAGALVGTGVGLLIPWLHYEARSTTEPEGTLGWLQSHQIRLTVVGQGIGLSGAF